MHLSSPPRGGFLATSLCAFMCLFGAASAQSLTHLSDYGVVVSGNLSTNSDIEGRTIVGGDITSKSSANFGIKLKNKVPKKDLVLRVQGNVVAGSPLQLNAGSLELGGSLNGRIVNYNGGGSLVSNPKADYREIFSDLTLASQNLATYGANSEALLIANGPGQPGPFRMTASPDSSGLAVFSINAQNLFGNKLAQQIELITKGASDILINVAGKSVNWTAGNMVGDLTKEYWRERVVWNFYEATSVDFGSKNMMGQVLAPYASVTASGNIDGSIFAKNLTTTSEVHFPGYNGSITVIPEPGTSALGLIAAAILLVRRKRVP